MRLSADKDDPGYDAEALKDCKSFVDGVEITNRCYTADEEEGKAWCFKLNELGNKFIDDATGEAAKEILSGEVVIMIGKGMNGYDAHSSH